MSFKHPQMAMSFVPLPGSKIISQSLETGLNLYRGHQGEVRNTISHLLIQIGFRMTPGGSPEFVLKIARQRKGNRAHFPSGCELLDFGNNLIQGNGSGEFPAQIREIVREPKATESRGIEREEHHRPRARDAHDFPERFNAPPKVV